MKIWQVSKRVLNETERAFRAGEHEIFVIWTSLLATEASQNCDSIQRIQRSIVPAQRPGRSAFGVWVHIDGSELQRIQLENYSRGERSCVQLHTHPGVDVTMSELDRKWEVVRHEGALSIIVPFFGQRGLTGFPKVNVYEREPDDWRLWGRDEVMSRLVVV